MYTCYASIDRYLLKLMYNRGKLKNDIFEVSTLGKKKHNSRQQAIKEWEEIEEKRKEMKNEINNFGRYQKKWR